MSLKSLQQQEQRTGWILAAPALMLLLLVFAYPIGRALWQSTTTQNLGTELQPVFSGFNNYTRMILDGRFWQSLRNSAVFTVASVTLELILGMGIALVLNRPFRGRGIVRTIAILPWALPTALIAQGYFILNSSISVLRLNPARRWA